MVLPARRRSRLTSLPLWRLACSGIMAVLVAGSSLPLFGQADDAPAAEPLPQDASLTPPVPIAPPTTAAEAEALSAVLYPDNRTPVEPGPGLAAGAGNEEAGADAGTVPNNSEGVASRPWKVTLHGAISEVYDDNIFISERNQQSDFITTLSPGIKLTLGDWQANQGNYLSFDYTLSALLFADHDNQDTIEQSAVLNIQWSLARFTLGLQFLFQDLSEPDVDAGDRTRRQYYNIALLNKYELRPQSFVEANFYNNIADYESRLSSTEWIARFWYNYTANSKLTVGPGAAFGYLEVSHSPSQTYEQLLVRINYATTEKLSLEADGGVELRQAGQSDRATPILNLSATYRPSMATTVRLDAYRKVQNSVRVAGENYTLSGFSLEASRTVHTGLDLAIAGGYNHSDYHATRRGDATNRTDNFFSVRPAARFVFARRWQGEVFYLYQQDDSTRGPSSFRDQQVGFRLRLDY